MRKTPQIYDQTSTLSSSDAPLGSLPDMLSCTVTEELNGEFYLEMKYAGFGLNAELLAVGRIIAVKLPLFLSDQGFRIVKLEKSLDGTITVSANHVSYDLSQIIVKPFSAAGRTSQNAFYYLDARSYPAEYRSRVSLLSDLDQTLTRTFGVSEPKPLRQCLLGSEGSVLDVYGGQFTFDNWNVTLEERRGEDRNLQIAYGKNLSEFKETDDISPYDSIYPYVIYNDTLYDLTNTTICPTAPIVQSGTVFGYPNTIPVDFSNDFSDAAPTQAQLYAKAQSYIAAHSTQPTANMATSFIDLRKIIGSSEVINLGDVVYLSVEPYHVSEIQLKVVCTVYDVLLDEYTSIQVGDKKVTLADQLAPLIK